MNQPLVKKEWMKTLDRFSIVYTVASIGVRDKEGVNRTRMTRTGADHHG
jgi:hypothetical protein